MAELLKKAAAGVAVAAGGTALVGVGVGVVVLAALVTLAVISFVISVPLWFFWNQLAPSLGFVPEVYQHLSLLQVFLGVAVVRGVRGLLFGNFKVKAVKKAEE